MKYTLNPILFADGVSSYDFLKKNLLETFFTDDNSNSYFQPDVIKERVIRITDKKDEFYNVIFIYDDGWFPTIEFGILEIFGMKFEFKIKNVNDNFLEICVLMSSANAKEVINAMSLEK